jgi:hypothetical protein
MTLNSPFAAGKETSTCPIEHYKHIDLPRTASEQWDVRRKGLLSTVGTHALDHLLREFGVREVRTKVRSVPSTGLAVSLMLVIAVGISWLSINASQQQFVPPR